MIKRLFDLAASALGLVVLSPVFLLVGIAIRLDSAGPTFYQALRVGKDGRRFGMLKFRTMRDVASSGPRVTAQDDPRVTRVGRILRQTKLNELPQLFNVLKGEMSLVGPRPEDPEFVEQYTQAQREVLTARPGITSPASIIYHDEEALLQHETAAQAYVDKILPSKLRLDLLYVRHRSFLLDLDVLVRTGVVLLPLLRQATPEVEEVLFGPVQRLAHEYLPWFAVDFLTAFVAVAAAGLIWRAQGPLDLGWGVALVAAFSLALAFSLVNHIMGLQRIAWRYASGGEVPEVALAAGLATGLVMVGNTLLGGPWVFPAGMLILAGVFALGGFLVTRYRRRLLARLTERWQHLTSRAQAGRENVLVIGGGEAGQLMVWLMRHNLQAQAFRVIGIVDDDWRMQGARVHGVSVLGTCPNIPKLVERHNVSLLVFAIHNIRPMEREAVLAICQSTGVRVAVMPDVLSFLWRMAATGQASLRAVETRAESGPAGGDDNQPAWVAGSVTAAAESASPPPEETGWQAGAAP